MKNEVIITGTIKNIRTFTSKTGKGTLLTGWLNQRDVSRTSDGVADRQVYVAGMNIVALDDSSVGDLLALDNARQGAEETIPVTITGRLVTRFDRRQDIPQSERRAPQLQLEVLEVATN